MQDDQQQTFRDEAGELLAELEAALLALERAPEDADLIGRTFRALHTLKGLCAMSGRGAAAGFVHQVETVFQHVRSGDLRASGEFVSLCLEAADLLRAMTDPADDDPTAPADALLERLRRLAPRSDTAAPAELPPPLADFLPRLTEHELARVRACTRRGWRFQALEVTLSLDDMERQLAAHLARIRPLGEPIATQPVPGQQIGDTMQFRLLVATDRAPRLLDRLLADDVAAVPPVIPRPPRACRIRFRPRADIFLRSDLPALFERLAGLGPCRIVALTDGVPDLASLVPADCRLAWDMVLTTDADPETISDCFPAVEAEQLRIEEIAADDGGDGRPKRLGEILVERGDLRHEDLERTLSRQKRVGELLVAEGVVSPDKVASALAEQEALRDQGKDAAASIRVAVGKLDRLVDLVGELVTTQARLTRMAGDLGVPGLSTLAEEVERLSAGLRLSALEMRMLPIGTTFGRFQRLVRDLARELGKEAELVTTGAETELDKTVMERLGDPLVHLIRNCLDHGIEPPAVRAAAGKPPRGTVHLAARHTGDAVEITVADDGAGLDPERLRARAAELGLLPAGAAPAQRELFDLIFAPGFTTCSSVSSVSGRGVGMDVVRRSVDTLRGTIDLASERGRGTTVTVRLPLTLAIVESLLVQVSDSRFVVPLEIVEECVEIDRDTAARGNRVAEVRQRLVPYIPLRERFQLGDDSPDLQQVVVTRVNGASVGLLVDQVIGEHQSVVKPLGKVFRRVEGVCGATVLGDGDLALILDMATLTARETFAAARA